MVDNQGFAPMYPVPRDGVLYQVPIVPYPYFGPTPTSHRYLLDFQKQADRAKNDVRGRRFGLPLGRVPIFILLPFPAHSLETLFYFFFFAPLAFCFICQPSHSPQSVSRTICTPGLPKATASRPVRSRSPVGKLDIL